MTKEELSTYQAQWLRLRGILREVKMMRLGHSGDPLYAKDLKQVEESLMASLAELKRRIEDKI